MRLRPRPSPTRTAGSPLRKRGIAILALATVACLAAVGAAAPASAAASTLVTGATWSDQNGNALQMHGLGIVKAGQTYYAFGEDKTNENSGNASFIAIPCYASTNLGTWTYQSEALVRTGSGDLGPNRVIERPKVLYNNATGQYVMYLHVDNSAYSEAKVGVATSSTPCGPYSYRGSFQPLGQQSRDIGVFQDSDGSGYLLTEDRAHGLRIDRLASDYLSVASSVAVLADFEAPAMVKVAGRYYLFGSHLTGWSTNDNQYATATSLAGPWSGWANFAPGGTNTYNTQTTNIITVQGSAGTTYVYAGDRWNPANLGSSKLVWLPLNISGTNVSLPYYRSWSIDSSAGTWSTSTAAPRQIFKNAAAGRCLDVTGAATATGTRDEVWDCNGGQNQSWQLNNDGSIRSAQTGLCLDVANASSTPGALVDQWTCNGQTNQKWVLNADGTVVGVQSNLCLDVSGQATANGTAVDIWTCNGQANQRWSAS